MSEQLLTLSSEDVADYEGLFFKGPNLRNHSVDNN